MMFPHLQITQEELRSRMLAALDALYNDVNTSENERAYILVLKERINSDDSDILAPISSEDLKDA
jgi:uncharacterized protein YbcI